jgi:type VI secretion system secreted protein VgrG
MTRSARFASPLKNKVEFYSMTGRETLGRLFTYEVDLLSDNASLDLSELLGKEAGVVFEGVGENAREFNGFVTQFSLVGSHGKFARYRATLRPWLWFLGQNRECRIFQKQTVRDIVKDLFRERGFTDFDDLLVGSFQPWEFLVQYRESDLNFVSRMLEHEGIYYFFKHHQGKHTLVLTNSTSKHPKHALVPYHAPSKTNDQLNVSHLDAWTVSRQVRQGHVTLRDFNFTYPSPFEGERDAPLPPPHSKYELYDYPGQINQPDKEKAKEATSQLAEIRVEEQQADYEVVRAAGPMRSLVLGDVFKLAHFPRNDQNDKDRVVVSTSYEITSGERESNQDAPGEAVFRVELSAIDATRQYRSPRITPKPVVEGPQTATVIGKDKEEISTDKYGRVLLKFHWDRSPARDQSACCWVRVSQFWAGEGWGSIHVPRVGQEVIVDFLEGDPDRPIVTGRVYNEKQPVPYDMNKVATQSGWKSRSSPGGQADNFNEIRFEDRKGEEELHVQAEKDMTTLVKHDRTTTILRNDTLNITGDQFIKIHGNLSMIVEGVTEKDNPDKTKPVKSSLGVTGAHRIDASDTIDIQAPNKITLTVGGSSITITPGSITISAGGSTIAVDANVFAKSKGEAQMKLDANGLLKSAGGALVELKGGTAVSSGSGGGSVTLDGDAAVKAGNIKLNAGKINGTGDSEIGLTVSSSSVKVTPASVETMSTSVKSTGTGAVEVTAPAIKLG